MQWSIEFGRRVFCRESSVAGTICSTTIHGSGKRAVRSRLYVAASLIALASCSSSGDASDPSSPVVPGETTGGASLAGRRPFPADNPWNLDVSTAPIDPRSSTLIASCGLRNLHPDFGTTYNGAPNGIPYVVVHSSQPKVPVSFDYDDESDHGSY